jgi:UDP-glucose 4-epimerase
VRATYSGLEVLITGGLGFVGSNLAIRLVDLGAKVTIVDSLVKGCGGNIYNIAPVADRVRLIECGVGDVGRLRRVLRRTRLIFNLAGEISHSHSMKFPERDGSLNAWAQLRFLEETARQAPGVRIVYAGTRQIFGIPQYLPVDESHPFSPVDFNGIHKLAATMYHLLNGREGKLDAIVLNLTNVYGPRMALATPCQGFLGNFVRKLMTGTPLEILGSGAQLRDPLFVDDAVDAFLKLGAAERPGSPMYNVGGPEAHTLAHMAEVVSAIGGVASPSYRAFSPDQKRIDIGSYCTDSSRIERDVAWTARVRFEEGIRRTLAFYDRELAQYLDPPIADPPCLLAARVQKPKQHSVVVA